MPEPEIDSDGMVEVFPPTGVDYEAIRSFQAYCHAQSRARGFHDEPDELKDLCEDLRSKGQGNLANYILSMYYSNRLMLIGDEIAEAHEEIRDGRQMDETYYDPASLLAGKPKKPEGVPSELGDIFIRLMDLSEEAEVDLAGVVKEKLEYNATRPFKHGRAF